MKYIESEVLTREYKQSNSIYIIITGDSSYDLRILKEIGIKYNGIDKILFNPTLKVQHDKGKNAFNSLKTLIVKYNTDLIICVIDGEYFGENLEQELRGALIERSYEIKEMIPIKDASLVKLEKGGREILLYCIISGIEVCIEEEIIRLIKIKLNVDIDTSRIETRAGKLRVKNDVKRVLRENNIKSVMELIRISGKAKLEEAFPNICAVFKTIEKEPIYH